MILRAQRTYSWTATLIPKTDCQQQRICHNEQVKSHSAQKFGSEMSCMHSGASSDETLAVVALGNTLRRDDGIAVALLDRLDLPPNCPVCRFSLGTFSTLLADCLQGHTQALIMDAVHTGGRPGTVTFLDLGPAVIAGTPCKARSTHGLSFIDEIKLRQESIPKQIWFLGIESGDDSFGEELSLAMQLQLPALMDQTLKVITSILSGEPGEICTNLP